MSALLSPEANVHANDILTKVAFSVARPDSDPSGVSINGLPLTTHVQCASASSPLGGVQNQSDASEASEDLRNVRQDSNRPGAGASVLSLVHRLRARVQKIASP